MAKLLGRSYSRAFCHCCNDPLVNKKIDRAREKRRWCKDFEVDKIKKLHINNKQ